MKDAYYFSHDANARNDPKMLLLRAKYGPAGYGVYFMILEMLREQNGFVLPAGEFIYESLSIGLGTQKETLEPIVKCCLEIGLLVLNENLYSPSLLRRMTVWEAAKERKSNLGKFAANTRYEKELVLKKGEICGRSADAVRTQCENDASACKESKGKESKGKESKGKEIKKERREESVIFYLWNHKIPSSLPGARALTPGREKHSAARLRELSADKWPEVIARVRASAFCNGKNDRDWVANFDWLIKPETWAKVLEGKYDDKRPAQRDYDPGWDKRLPRPEEPRQ